MAGHRTFTDAVLGRADQVPGQSAFVVLNEGDGQSADEVVSYAQLDGSARALAHWLQERGAQHNRVLIMQSSRKLFAVSFLACLYSGAVAVPVPMPTGRFHHDERVAGILKDAAPRHVLTDIDGAPEASQLLARTGHGDVDCLAVDAVLGAGTDPGQWQPPKLGPDSLAYLQYTSGSTREPRGVMISHGNLLANQRAIQQALRIRDGARFCGWLPFHHDMGLVGQLLLPLYVGGTAVLLSPSSFVRHPVSWLRAISQHRAEISGAPDFGFELCLERIAPQQTLELDLSDWETVVSAGEPVRPAILRAFAERFAPTGLRPEAMTPCYGLAESTLLTTGARSDGPPRMREADSQALEHHTLRQNGRHRPGHPLAGCGPAAGAELRIVDPETLESLPDGNVGEIWVRGESVAQGYWNRPGETAETFQATTAEGETGFLRTGDLGVLDDGELYVTGRIKDMIIVAGRNLYPQDVEHSVQRVSALFGSGTAFAVPGERERIVIVQELRTRSRYDVDYPALTASVRSCLAEEFEVQAGGVLLVRPGTVRRTTSGKVERATMRQLFLDGRLQPLHEEIEPELDVLVTAGDAT